MCDQARVPLKVVPLTAQYWERVVAHSLGEIAAGRTPNPDVLCNSRIKFGAFLEHIAASYGGAFDRVASGHYARLERAPGCAPALRLSADEAKDQTYFLAGLAPQQLAAAMFPLGGCVHCAVCADGCRSWQVGPSRRLPKPSVRELAAAGRLPTASRKDSQGICFLGKVKFSEFVAEHLGARPGPLIEAESGTAVGSHRGFWFHTVGQRQGLGLPGGPWYVTAKDPARNVVYVSRRYHEEGAARRNAFRVGAFSWLGDARPAQGPAAGTRLKVRHGARMYAAALVWETPAEVEAAEAAAAAAIRDRLPANLPEQPPPPAAIVESDAPPRPAPPKAAPPPPPGLTARVVLDGHDQGLAVRFARGKCTPSAADARASIMGAGGAVCGAL